MFRKLSLLIVFLAVGLVRAQDLPTTLWSDLAQTDWYSDSEDNFTLSTAEEFAGLSVLVSDGTTFENKTIELGATIDLDGHLWTPVGTMIEKSFKGTFDGNDYIISNLIVNQPDRDFAGLFGSVLGATITNVHIDGAIVFGQSTVGGLVANLSTDSSVENSSIINGSISCATGWYGGIAGGLVGGLLTRSSVKKSSFSGTVNGGDQIGGLVGTAWDTTLIEESFSEGLVSGDNIVGGLVGFTTMNFPPNPNSRNYVKNSYSRSNVIATGMRAGGLYGSPETNGSIENSYSTGTVSATETFGGSIGNIMYDTPVFNTFWDVESSGVNDGIGEYTPGDDISVIGKTTEEMKTDDFLQLLDNGQNLWIINPEMNDGYPILAHQALGVSEISFSNFEARIFPTIANDVLHILSNVTGGFKIVDMTGKVLLSNHFNSNTTLNVSALQNGIYIIVIESGKQRISRRFIKN